MGQKTTLEQSSQNHGHFEPQGEICFFLRQEKTDFSPDEARFEMTGL